MWKPIESRLALLELYVRKRLERREAQAEVFHHLAELPWTRRTGRRDELRLPPEHIDDVERLLDRVWPDWENTHAALEDGGFEPTLQGWHQLEERRREASVPSLSTKLINHRVAIALTAPHSKSSLTDRRRAALGKTTVVHDGLVRLRPPPGLVAHHPGGTLDLTALADILGEAPLTERAFLDGLRIEGDVRALLLVENLGAWREIRTPEGWLLAHVPGWNTRMTAWLFEAFPSVPTLHFTDLDPNGVRMLRHLRSQRADLKWFVPEFWAEYVERHAMKKTWPRTLDLQDAPPLVRSLAARGLWMEQERIVFDDRIVDALESFAAPRDTDATTPSPGTEFRSPK